MNTKIHVTASYEDLMRHFGDERLADACYRETHDVTIDADGNAQVEAWGMKCWLDASLFAICHPAAACQSCGGWSKSGGMSHKADGAEGCSCSPCRDTPETPKTHTNGGFGGFDGYDLVLVSCCGEKLEGEHRAEDLYQSQLFKASVAWAKANGKEWAILSAKHGLVWPDEVIESYDVDLSTPKSRSPHIKPIYYKSVIKKIRDYKNRVSCPKIAVLAGKHYLEPFQYEPNTSFPLAGKGIGQRLQFLKKAAVAVTACVGQLELF